MKVNKSKQQNSEILLTVAADGSDLAPIKQMVLKKLAGDVKLPGFRPGTAPLNLVEKNINSQSLQAEVIETAINRFYSKVIETEKLRPVSDPEVNLKKFVPYDVLEFSAKVSVIGEVQLVDYKKVKLALPKVEVKADELEGVIESLRLRAADKIAVERPAKNGDELIIDFKGQDSDGQPVAGADGKEYPLLLGSKSFIPGFEDNLVGVKAGGEKTFTLSFPKDYGVKALRNKKVTFNVEVKTVNEVKKPKVDDDFAAKVGPFKTLGDLKKDIEVQLTTEREREARRNYEEELLKLLSSKTKVDIPKSLVENQLDRMEEEEKRNLAYRGQTWQEHLEAEGLSEEAHREQKRNSAEDRIKIGIMLSEISESEGIVVTPEEFEVRLQLLRGQYKDTAAQQQLEKPEVQRDLVSQMVTEKTLDKLVSYATK